MWEPPLVIKETVRLADNAVPSKVLAPLADIAEQLAVF